MRIPLLGRNAHIVDVVRLAGTERSGDMHRQDVEFSVEGDVTLRGWLFTPNGPGPFPAITMAHVTSSTATAITFLSG